MDCLECPYLDHCDGMCEEMHAKVENNKMTIEEEDRRWASE